jgi:hypothetical protein
MSCRQHRWSAWLGDLALQFTNGGVQLRIAALERLADRVFYFDVHGTRMHLHVFTFVVGNADERHAYGRSVE